MTAEKDTSDWQTFYSNVTHHLNVPIICQKKVLKNTKKLTPNSCSVRRRALRNFTHMLDIYIKSAQLLSNKVSNKVKTVLEMKMLVRTKYQGIPGHDTWLLNVISTTFLSLLRLPSLSKTFSSLPSQSSASSTTPHQGYCAEMLSFEGGVLQTILLEHL